MESALIGTVYLMVLCALFIVPVGVATAVYLEEYANRDSRLSRLIEVNIQNLAAVPSVVYGILGLAFIVRGPLGMGPVLLAGALTLGLLVLPVVIIVAREAIRAVPSSIREGSLALGATQWQTIWKQVLPGALPGIATGVILALSRAIGETAPLLVIGAATFARFNPEGITRPLHGHAPRDLRVHQRRRHRVPGGRSGGDHRPPGHARRDERRGDFPTQSVRAEVVIYSG